MPKIDFQYVGLKFVRDFGAIFVASDAVRQFLDGVGTPSMESIYAAVVGALGTAVYRIVRDLVEAGPAE